MRLAAALAAILLAAASPLSAQEWWVTAQVGRVPDAATPAGAAGSSNLVLGLSRTGLSDWLGASAALPVDGDPFWAVLSGWKRFETRGAVAPLLDIAAHGFMQRLAVDETLEPAPTPVPIPGPGAPTIRKRDVSGHGIGGEALAGLRATMLPLRVEVRGGVAAQQSELEQTATSRVLPTANARLTLLTLPVVVGAETRAWWNGSESHAYGGGTVELLQGPLRLWGSAGGWLSGGVPDLAWSAGARAAVAERLELRVAVRDNAFDPLYRSLAGTSVSFAAGIRFGGARTVRAPVPARYEGGRAEIRIAADEVKGTPSIAGDFTGWKPVAMQRAGDGWTWSAPLAPGVYEYAFVAPDGTWFVPDNVPGRKDDGMGGHVAVLVVGS